MEGDLLVFVNWGVGKEGALLCSRRPGDHAHTHTDPACSIIVNMHHKHTLDTWINKMILFNGHNHRAYLAVANGGISQVRARLMRLDS